MNWAIKQLLQRGYWDQAGDGSDGSAGDAAITEDATTVETGDKAPDSTPAETEKKSSISESEAKLLKEVMQKKTKIQELERTLQETRQQFEPFQGLDPEAIKAMLKEREDSERKTLEQKGEWDKLKERMAKEHQSEKQALQAKLDEMNAQITQRAEVIERLTLGHQFDNSSYVRDELVLTPRKARAVYGAHFDVREDGAIVGYDKPRGAANRTELVDGSGEPLSFDEAMKRLIEADPDRDDLLKSKKRPGAASTTGNSGFAKQASRPLTPSEKVELGLKAQSR